jgi:hypothetical protein
MDGTRLTYRELAGRLGCSVEAARRRALRARWVRQSGNDGKVRVLLPEDYEIDRRPDGAPDVRPDVSLANDGHAALVSALQSHIKTLAAENEALKQDLTVTRADLSAHVETLKAQLAGADARAGEEAAKTARAIKAFADLAERLDQLAAERARPWWRRLVG